MGALARKLSASPDSASDIGVAFDALYQEQFRFAWSSLRRLGIPVHSIDDAVQELWLTAHRRLDTLKPEASARAWSFGIARRVASHYRRSESRRQRKLDAFECVKSDAKADPASAHEGRLDLEALLSQLSESTRIAFVLSELEGWTAKEIASCVDANHNTVQSRVRIAKAQLRKHLAAADRATAIDEELAAYRDSTGPASGDARRCSALLAIKLAQPAMALAARGGAWAGLKSTLLAAGVACCVIVPMPSTQSHPTVASPVLVDVAHDGHSAPPAKPRSMFKRLERRSASGAAHAERSHGPVVPEVSVSASAAVPVRNRVTSRPVRRKSKRAASRKQLDEAPADDLREQLALLRKAKSELDAGAHAEGLRTLATHARRYPGSSLADIRQRLEMDGLCSSGRADEARRLARSSGALGRSEKMRSACLRKAGARTP